MNINTKASDYLLKTSREYAIYVCSNRAIPSVTDGLKDGQRKALWIARNKSEKIKTISLAGELISSGLFLHGDQSAAQTISLMSGPFCNNIPFFKGIGSFGTKVSPQSFGAPRYTYVKKSKAADEIMLKDLDIVPLKENYDGSTLEPETFLPIIPTVLLNGISGIAVGWSTDILPHSLKDLSDAVLAVLEGKNIKRIKPHYDYLDIDVNDLGGNQWEFFGKIDRIDHSTIKVKSLPPDLSLEKFRERLDQYEEEGKINNYIDDSSEEIQIIIKFKRGYLNDKTDQDLIEFLKLKSKKTERIVVLGFDGNSIKQYECPEDLIVDFVQWRFGYYITRYEKMLANDKYEIKYWQGLKACFDKNIPNKLVGSKNKQDIVDKIVKITNELDDKQLDKLASLPTFRWNDEYYKEVLKKIEELEKSIQEYTDILADNDRIIDIYKNEVKAIKTLKMS